MATPDHCAKLRSLIKDIQFTMMTTTCADGSLRSRPMATRWEDEFDGTLWFFTHDHDAKVHEILEDTHVNLSYADPGKKTTTSPSPAARRS
jgi:general stress protein 26